MATTTANLRDLYREALTYRDVREAVNRASHNPSFGHHVLAWDAALAAVEDLVGPRLAPFRSTTRYERALKLRAVTREYSDLRGTP